MNASTAAGHRSGLYYIQGPRATLAEAAARGYVAGYTVTPEQAVREAREGSLHPVYLVLGEETYLQSAVVKALREATLKDGTPGLNEDQLVAGEASIDAALSAARTLPMMAKRRWVLVRSIERWEGRGETKGSSKRRGKDDPLNRLADYCLDPVPSTVLVLVTPKLDKRRRLVATATKQGFLVSCATLSRQQLPDWIVRRARHLGNRMSRDIAELIAELAGPDMSTMADAVERVCLYAGQREITEDDIAECVVRLRPTDVWQLGNAVGRRDLGSALATLNRVYDPHDRGIRLVGALAWSARRLLRFEAALHSGLSPNEAGARVGAHPGAVRDLVGQVKRTTRPALEGWLETLAEVDLALKGGSRRPPKSVLEYAIIRACGSVRSSAR